MRKRIAAILCVFALGAGSLAPIASAQFKPGPVPAKTKDQKEIKRLTNQIRKLNRTVAVLRTDRDKLSAALGADVQTKVSTMMPWDIWSVIPGIGIRLSEFGGYHVSIEEKIDDAGTYETFSFTQATYFMVLG